MFTSKCPYDVLFAVGDCTWRDATVELGPHLAVKKRHSSLLNCSATPPGSYTDPEGTAVSVSI